VNTGTAVDLNLNSADSAPQAASPTLSHLRISISSCRRSSALIALSIFLFDSLLFVVGQMLVLHRGVLGFTSGCLLTSLGIVRLFIVGHDACHGSLTSRPWLNKVIGRLAFCPSLTAYSLWHAGHNVLHHGFNNLKGRDFVWVPISPAEYKSLPLTKRWTYRLYRSMWGAGFYYFFVIWLKRLWFPTQSVANAKRKEFFWDSCFTTAFAACWLAWLIIGAGATRQRPTQAVLFGIIVPYILWTWTMGTVVYLHHTGRTIVWFNSKQDWRRYQAPINGTATFNGGRVLGFLFHYIFDHQAHHLDPAIPLYRLRRAQKILQSAIPGEREAISFRHYLTTIKNCKLYDFDKQCWERFPQ